MRIVSVIVLVFSTVIAMNSASDGQEVYRLPPQGVVDVIDAKPEPGISFSPDAKTMLLLGRNAMPDISDISRRMLQLAGVRIDPVANSRFQTTFYNEIRVRKTVSESTDLGTKVELPDDVRIGTLSWSHDSSKFAFTVVTDEGTDLHVADVETAKSTLLCKNISLVMGTIQWMPDAKHILCTVVPENRGEEPVETRTPIGPNVQESSGNTSPTRTYQDLLKNPYDESMFEYFATSKMQILSLDGAVVHSFPDAIYASISPSPDGQSLLTTTVEKPFSYLMTYRSFPKRVSVLGLDGAEKYLVAEIPLEKDIPIEGVRTGPRNIDWMSSRDASLVWAEALDGGDPNKEVDFRDKLMTVAAPFDVEAVELKKIEHRSYGLSYLADAKQFMTTEYDRDRRWVKTLLHDQTQPDASPVTIVDRSIRDRYGDPGQTVSVRDESGHAIALQNGDWIFRMGSGASPKGNLPFVDSFNLKTQETKRFWRCEEGAFESAVRIAEIADDGTLKVITDFEDPTSPPNYRLRDLSNDTMVELTAFKDPTPQIRGIKKELITYERNDGVQLSATLYLPADYKEGTRLPLLVWAYPREFNDAKTAGQVSGSDARFTQIRGLSHLALLTQGYAIMDNATMPVVGDPETMNDTFVEQIVASAQAAIDKAAEMGVADPNRVCVGGHSYGAFMTANLLAHCDLFKAGVARSGAYNRTLTPFGFQSERRSFWDAKEIYFNISPFMHANKINEPLLLTHGEIDNNSGTFPIQSERLYQAIKGNGGTTRLVMLPYESHGYRARQSVLHVHAETIDWFDKYVKDANLEVAKGEDGEDSKPKEESKKADESVGSDN
jgi:dipeptidyl aminopeptidase/acylaminoacyl peptidase